MLFYTPFAAPGNVEKKNIFAVEGATATETHWKEKAATAISTYGGFASCESVAGSGSTKFLVNVKQVQNIVEY